MELTLLAGAVDQPALRFVEFSTAGISSMD
jgi:hypothetical protein